MSETPDPNDDLWDIARVAQFLGVERDTVSAYVSRGYLPQPTKRLGRSPGWPPQQIIEWKANRPGQGRRRPDPA